jgi:vancomycin resistance protein YoaR
VRAGVLGLIAALVVGAAGAGGVLGYTRCFPPDRSLPGTYVGGALPPDGVALGAWLTRRAGALEQRQMYLRLPDRTTVELSFAQLGIALDVDRTRDLAFNDARRGSIGERLYRAVQAREGKLDEPLRWSFDAQAARRELQRIAPAVYREPVDARLDLEVHRKIPDRPGLALDVPATLARIEHAGRDDATLVPIAVRAVPAQVTAAMLANIDVSDVLSAYETHFGGTGKSREHNVRVAAHYLNGTVIAPGQTISFNKVVGPRTLARGFTWAPVIVDDELKPGVGGGTCQVATTLHAAAVYGALDVVRRRSHSRPCDDVPLGLDATVVYGKVDLELKNPYAQPLIIHAFTPEPGKLRVELLGRTPPGKIVEFSAVQKTYDFYRRVTQKAWLGDRAVRKQKGHKGYDVISVVRVTYPDGHQVDRHYASKYWPVPEVYWVGPGFDASTLPALPDGADHVEYEGVGVASATGTNDGAAPGGASSASSAEPQGG